MDAILCQGLSKSYGQFTALRDLDIVVDDGVVFGFLGPNGAGKTTTVKLLTGLGWPTSGRALVAGVAVDPRASSFRAKIGYLPEEPAFYGWMNGREYLVYVGRLFGLPTKAAALRAEELLEQAGLHEAGGRRIGGYSRGMRQRLGLAQALVNRPRVLFLDEPCSALDPVGRREVLELIQRLRGSVTIFMSTHILADVERVCDRVGVIDRGRMIACAGVNEIRDRNARPAFLLQFAERVNGLAESLSARPWVARVERGGDGTSLRVIARDEGTARQELPVLAAGSGLTLLRYEMQSPTLEDVFVSLVGGVEGGNR